MPNITTADTFTKTTTGFGGLQANGLRRTMLFSGSSVGTTCVVKYTDDTGTDATLEDGSITVLPTSLVVELDRDLKIVTTGSPNLNVTIDAFIR